MEIYNSRQSDFNIEPGNTAILGFQQVLTNPEKVFVWVRGAVDRPKNIDRHKTTKMANNSYQKLEWAKSVWLIDKVLEHFGKQLEVKGITREHFDNLSDDELSNKWETVNDGQRNFLKAVIMNPISEVTGEPITIQVTQQAGTIPKDLIERSIAEANGDSKKYERLLNKYINRSMVKTYVDAVTYESGIPLIGKQLVDVFVRGEDNEIYPVYETNEVTLGEPEHIFVKHEKPVLLPKRSFAQIHAQNLQDSVDAFDQSIHFSKEDDDYKIEEEDIVNNTSHNSALKQ